MAITVTASERQAFHRAGRNALMDRRVSEASKNNTFSPGDSSCHRSKLPTIAGAATTANVAYWVYVGRTAKTITAAKVLFHVTAGAAAGAQVAEVAIATSDAAPNRAAQTLTVVAVNATLDDLTGTGPKGNTTAMTTSIAPNTHLWVGFRENMAGGRPDIYGHTFDCSNGEILSTAAAGVLAVGSYTGALITASVAWQAPALFLSEV